jgi:hypothetical protein
VKYIRLGDRIFAPERIAAANHMTQHFFVANLANADIPFYLMASLNRLKYPWKIRKKAKKGRLRS